MRLLEEAISQKNPATQTQTQKTQRIQTEKERAAADKEIAKTKAEQAAEERPLYSAVLFQ